MTRASKTAQDPGPDLAERAGYLIEVAARAPSVHNTQPWRFTVTEQAMLKAGRSPIRGGAHQRFWEAQRSSS